MVEYIEAIKKPFADLKTFAIGSVLGAIPLANLVVSGYGLKTAEDVMNKKNKLRKWSFDDLGEYVIKIIKYFIISFAYMLIPGIILVVGIGGALFAGIANYAANPEAIGQAIMSSLLVGAPILLLGAILMAVACFLLPMAIMKWLKSGSLKSAIGLGAIVKNSLTADYIISLAVIIVYAILLMIPVAILAVIPLIGILAAGAYAFCMSVTSYTILAQTVKK